MPCIVEPGITGEQNLIIMLCKACKLLTKEQLWNISSDDIYISLHDWYLQHLMLDYDNMNQEEKDMAVSEARRLGHVLEKTKLGTSIMSIKEWEEENGNNDAPS